MSTAKNFHALGFIPAGLRFIEGSRTNVFAQKNNKTVAETLTHHRYQRLTTETEARYPTSLNKKLGIFLSILKASGDPFYLRFLNRYGDGTYCTFTLVERVMKKGLYVYVVGEQIKYVGKTIRTFKRRIDEYGTIRPKNCYLDGQSTNCHLNTLVSQHQDNIKLYLCPMTIDADIAGAESNMIRAQDPEWNIALRLGWLIGMLGGAYMRALQERWVD